MTRYRVRILVAVLACPAFFALSARADRLNSIIKSASSPSNYRQQIQALLNTEVKALGSDDPETQKDARKAIIEETENHSGTTASPQYQTEYATDLAKALLPAVKANTSVRFRVNAAVAARDVAALTVRGGGDSSALAPIVQICLADKNPAVVLWGIKAAKFVMDSQLENGGSANALAGSIVKAATSHPDSGYIVEETYAALTFQGMDRLRGNPQFAQLAAGTVPDLLNVIDWRAAQYRSGGDPPPSPEAESPATVYLSVTAYPAIAGNPALRDRTLKGLGEMTCAVLRAMAAGNSSPELLEVAKACGRGFNVFGQQMQNDPIRQAGKAISEISTNTDPTKLGTLCENLTTSLSGTGVNINSAGSGAALSPTDPAAIAGSGK